MLLSKIGMRFWAIAGAVSIRWKVLGIVIGVVLLLALFVTLQTRLIVYQHMNDEIEKQGMSIGTGLVSSIESFLGEGDLPTLRQHLQDVQKHYSNQSHNTQVEYIVIIAADGETIAHSYPDDAPTWTQFPYTPVEKPLIRQIEAPDGEMIDVIVPLPNANANLHVGLSEARVRQTANAVTLQIIYVTVAMLLIGVTAAVFLTWILTRPILTLVDATRAVAAGDFSRQVPRWANDEIGELSEAFNTMTTSLASADKERREREHLREQYISGVISAQEEERKRIARELHDSTSQSLSSLLVGLRHLQEISETPEVKNRADDLRKIVGQTLDEVHLIAHQLRPSVLDDVGLIAALERYIQDYRQRYPIQIDFITRNINRLPPVVETSIYRIVQEGLTNIARHAGATDASILIEDRGHAIRIIIEDNGKGFDPARVKEQSLGLQGMQERARLFGGSVTIESTPGAGASLYIELPHQEKRKNDRTNPHPPGG